MEIHQAHVWNDLNAGENHHGRVYNYRLCVEVGSNEATRDSAKNFTEHHSRARSYFYPLCFVSTRGLKTFLSSLPTDRLPREGICGKWSAWEKNCRERREKNQEGKKWATVVHGIFGLGSKQLDATRANRFDEQFLTVSERGKKWSLPQFGFGDFEFYVAWSFYWSAGDISYFACLLPTHKRTSSTYIFIGME